MLKCTVCGRVIGVPIGHEFTAESLDGLPPCGWRPLIHRCKGHVWVEVYHSRGEQRKFSCPHCRRSIILEGDDEDARKTLDAKPECLGRHRLPPLPERVMTYGKAVTRWLAAGRPTRSDEEVREIFEVHCKPCEHFDERAESCALCGCRVAASGAPLRNKLRMATEHCPLNPPKW